MSNASTAVINLVGKDQGLSTILATNLKALQNLTTATVKGSEEFNRYSLSASTIENALLGVKNSATGVVGALGEVSGTASKGYQILTSNSERTIKAGEALDNVFNKLTLSAVGFGNQTSAINTVLQPAAGFLGAVAAEATGLGKAFVVLNEVEKPVVGGLQAASKAAGFLSNAFGKLGVTGQFAAGGMASLSNALDKFTGLVQKADLVGDLYQTLEKIKSTLPEIAENIGAVTTVVTTIAQSAAPIITAGDATTKFNLAMNVLAQVGKGAVKDFAQLYSYFVNYAAVIKPVISAINTLGNTIRATIYHAQGFEKSLSSIDNLGLDTSAARLATSLGAVGENLLFDTKASKQFADTCVAEFARIQDSVSFITTLGAGQEAGIPALSKQLSELVDGPLQNAITKGEAASAMYQSLSAGIGAATGKLKESQPFMEAALKLAAGTETNAATTVDTLAKVTYAYNLNVKDAAKTAGVLAGIVDQGIITFPQLAGGIGRVAGVAAQAKIPLTEMAGSISALTKTMSGDDAMSGYMSLLNSIAGAGEQSTKAAAELGVQFDLQAVKAKGLLNVLKDLYDKSGGNVARIKEIIPDSLAFSTSLTLMTTAFKDAKLQAETIGKATGEDVDKIFGARQQSLIKQTTALMNGYQEVLGKFGEKFAPSLQPGLDFLKEVLTNLKKIPEPVQAILGSIVAFNAGLEKAQGFINIIINAITKLTGTFIAYRFALLFATNQFGSVLSSLKDVVRIGATTQERLAGLKTAFDKFTGATRIATEATEKFKQGQTALSKVSTILTTDIGKSAIARERATRKASAVATAANNPDKYTGAANDIITRLPINAQGVAANKFYSEADKRATEKLNNAKYAGAASDITTRLPVNEQAVAVNRFYNQVDNRAVKNLSQPKYNEVAIDKSIDKSIASMGRLEKATLSVKYGFTQVRDAAAALASPIANAVTKIKQAGLSALTTSKETELTAAKKADQGILKGNLAPRDAVAVRDAAQQYVNQLPGIQKVTLSFQALTQSLRNNAMAAVKAAIAEERYQAALARSGNQARLAAAKNEEERKAIEQRLREKSQAFANDYVDGMKEIDKASLTSKYAMSQVGGQVSSLATKFPLLGAAVKGFGFATGFATQAIKGLWEAFGPLAIALLALKTAFDAIGDVLPINFLGMETAASKAQNAAAKYQELRRGIAGVTDALSEQNKQLDNSRLSLLSQIEALDKLQKKETDTETKKENAEKIKALKRRQDLAFKENDKKYGFLAGSVVGAFDAANSVRNILSYADPFSYGNSKVRNDAQKARIGQDVRNIGDTIQGVVDDVSGKTETFNIAKEDSEAVYNKFNSKALNLQKNNVNTKTGRDLLEQTKNRKLSSEELLKLTTAENKALEENKKQIDAQVAALQALLEEEKNPERRKAYEQTIADLNKLASQYEKNKNAAIEYLNAINSMRDRIYDNTYDPDKKIKERLEANNKLSGDLTEKIKSAKDENEKALRENQKAAVDGNSAMLLEIQKGMDTASGVQKKELNSLLTAYQEFSENALRTEKGKEFADLGTMQAKADKILAEVEANVDNLAASVRVKIVDEVLNQKIKDPTSNAEGGILAVGQIKTALAIRAKLIEEQVAQKEVSINNRAITKIEQQEALGRKRSLVAQKETIQLQIKNDEILLKAKQENLKRLDYGKETEIYKRHQDEIVAFQNQIEQKKLKAFNLSLDNKAELLERQQSRESALLEKHISAGLFKEREGQQKLFELRQKQNVEQRKIISDRIAGLKKNGGDFAALEVELLKLQTEFQSNQVENNKRLLDQRYEDKQLSVNKERNLLEKSLADGKVTEEKFKRESFKLRQQDNLNRQAQLQEQIIDLKKRNKDARALELELIALRSEFKTNQVEEDKELLEKRYEKKKLRLEKERSLLETSFLDSKTTEEKYTAESFRLRKQDNLDRQSQLQEQIIDLKKRNKDVRAVELELAQVQIEARRIAIEEQAKITERHKAQISNASTITIQSFTKQINLIDLQSDKLQRLANIEKSRNDVVSSQYELTQGRLDNQLRLTGDIIKVAELEAQIAKNRYKDLTRTQAIEKQQLATQTKLQELSLKKEAINNRIAKAENQRASALLEKDIAQARRENKSQEELDALLNQKAALVDQKELLEAQTQELTEQSRVSKEINANSLSELNNRQQLAREGGAIDLELAKRKQILAVYDKMREEAQLYAQEVDLINAKETNRAEALTKAYERQTSVIEAQKGALESRTNRVTSELQIALELTQSEFQKRVIAQSIAQIKYKSLISQQQLEQKVLELQILQNKAALERERIQLRAQQAQNKADIMGAYADAQKIFADEKSTDVQKRAAQLNVEAKIEQGAALAFGTDQLEKKAKNQDFFEQRQRENLADSQAIAKNSAMLEIINSLGPRQKGMQRAFRNELLQRNLGFDYRNNAQNFRNLNNGNKVGAADIFASRFGYDDGYKGDYGKEAFGRNGIRVGVQGVEAPSNQADNYEQIRSNFMAMMQEFIVPPRSSSKPVFQMPKLEAPGSSSSSFNDKAKPAIATSDKKTESFGDVHLTIDNLTVTVEAHKDAAKVAANEVSNAILDQLHNLGTKLKSRLG